MNTHGVPQIAAAALQAAVPLDLRAVRERLEMAGGGLEVAYIAPGLEIRVEVFSSPGPGTFRVERSDTLYVALDGSGVLGVDEGNPLALIPGEAAVVPTGARHVLFGNPQVALLAISGQPRLTTSPLALCRRA
jgi:mannose-6-phosphate isomerase-like protein (cupin superfamily)